TDLVFAGDAGAARTVLDAVAGSLITVTSLTFSLTVVTLQLASSQFSPRLLRTFTSDVFVQATLGIFLATFTYSLTVLRTVRSPDAALPEFVPRLSVTMAFLLAVGSVVTLVVFLAHLAQQIRIETMLRDVHVGASATLQATLGRGAPGHSAHRRGATEPAGTPKREVPPSRPAAAFVVRAPSSGFLVRIDEQGLLGICLDLGLVLEIDRPVGSSLVDGTPLGVAWPLVDADGSSPGSLESVASLGNRVANAVHIGFERTAAQDIGFGLRQLTDVANKALSPGINDPTTAVHSLGHISALLCELADHDLGPVIVVDDERRVRVVVHRPALADLVELSIAQPRRYGAADPQVVDRLFQLLDELAWRFPSDHRPVVRVQLSRLVSAVAAQEFDPHERARFAEAADRVRKRLADAGHLL
ncbi:MAG: DUF2254 domain-containing protein, partial [Lapillicoccus sp.]